MTNVWFNVKSVGQSIVFANSRHQGNHYEQMAADYLRRQGLSLVTQNVNYRLGELDLVMRDGSTLVFVEVRYRASTSYGHAAETVTPSKRARLIKQQIVGCSPTRLIVTVRIFALMLLPSTSKGSISNG